MWGEREQGNKREGEGRRERKGGGSVCIREEMRVSIREKDAACEGVRERKEGRCV